MSDYEADTPTPEQQAGDDVGLVAALEGETQEFEGGTGYFIDAEDAVNIATPYEARLVAAEKRCAELTARPTGSLVEELEALRAVQYECNDCSVFERVFDVIAPIEAAWQAERDKQNETIDYLQACGMQVQSEMEQLSEQWGVAEQAWQTDRARMQATIDALLLSEDRKCEEIAGLLREREEWRADRQALADLRAGVSALVDDIEQEGYEQFAHRSSGAAEMHAGIADRIKALLATPTPASGDAAAAAGQGDDGDDDAAEQAVREVGS